MATVKHKVSPAAVGWAFLRLGMTTYGGAASAAIGDEVVRRQGWITNDEYLTFRSIALVAPGPNSPALAILVGRHLAGWRGALLAWSAATLPGIVVILVLGVLYLDPRTGLGPALRGCAAAAVGLTFANAIEMTYASRSDRFRLLVVALTAIAVIVFHASLWMTFALFVPLTLFIRKASIE
jgi:chromate transport protein ChrA